MTILWEIDEEIRLLEELNQALRQGNQSLGSTLERMMGAYAKHAAARWALALLVKDETASPVAAAGDLLFTLTTPFSIQELPCWPEIVKAKPVLIAYQAGNEGAASRIPLADNEVHTYLPIGEQHNMMALIVIGSPTPPSLGEGKLLQLLALQAALAIHQSRALKTAQLNMLEEYYDWLKLRLHSTVDQSISSAASLISLIARLVPENPTAASQYLVHLEELVNIAITDTHQALTEFRGRILMFSDEANHESIKDKGAPG